MRTEEHPASKEHSEESEHPPHFVEIHAEEHVAPREEVFSDGADFSSNVLNEEVCPPTEGFGEARAPIGAKEFYRANPGKPPTLGLTLATPLVKMAGQGLTFASAALDARSLYHEYKRSKATGNYANLAVATMATGAGWRVGMPAGAWAATAAAAKCAPAGLWMSLGCAAFWGAAASLTTYTAAKHVVTETLAPPDRHKNRPSAEKPSPEPARPMKQPKSFFDSIKNQENAGATFLENLEAKLSEEPTRALLEKSFQKKYPEKIAEEKTNDAMRKINAHLKQHLKKDYKDDEHLHSKKELLNDLRTQTDAKTASASENWMSDFESEIDKSKQQIHDLETGENKFNVFNNAMSDLRSIQYVRGEIVGIHQGFQAAHLVGRLLDSPELMKAAQFGMGLMDVGMRITTILAANAQNIAASITGTVSQIGVAALTGNWIALGMSIVGLILPFLNLNNGPSFEEVIFDYLQKMTKHLDHRFDYVDQTLKQIRDDINYLIELVKVNIEISKKIREQLHDFQRATQFTLEKIQSMIIGLRDLVKAGFDEILFGKFRSMLDRIYDLLMRRPPELTQVLPDLLDELARDYIQAFSRSSFYTAGFSFDSATRNLAPTTNENLFFSRHQQNDTQFIENPARLQQAFALDQLYNTNGDSRFLLGFHAAYAEANPAIADERMTLREVNEEIESIKKQKQTAILEKEALENTNLNPVTTETLIEKEARLGDVKKLFHLHHEIIRLDKRASQLYKMRAIKTHAEKKQKAAFEKINKEQKKLEQQVEETYQRDAALQQNAAQLDRTMQKLIPGFDIESQSPPVPLPLEAKEWISTHQALEALKMNALILEQQQHTLTLNAAIAGVRARPSFQIFNIPIWIKAIEAYLQGLTDPVLDRHYHRTHVEASQKIILMGEDMLAFVGFLQKQPAFSKNLWSGYTQALLHFLDFYHRGYEERRSQMTQSVQDEYLCGKKLNDKLLRVGEAEYVQTLLKNTSLTEYLLIVHTQKKLMSYFLALVDAPAELQNAFAALPDQNDLRTQLQKSAEFTRPAPFTQDEIYQQINHVSSLLSRTLFRSGYVMPAPQKTPIGIVVDSALQRLYQYMRIQQMRQFNFQLQQQHFSTTFAYFTDEHFIQPRRPDMRTPEQQTEFETQMQKALLNTNMRCATKAVSLNGDTGAGKTGITNAARGCKLEYIPNPKGPNHVIKEVIEVVKNSCPPGVTPGVMGHTQKSQTAFPAAVMQAGPNPSTLMDNAGFLENRPELRLLTIMAKQIGFKTTKTFNAHNMVLSYLHFGDPKVTALLKDIKSLAAMFKKPLREYLSAINLVITKAPRNEDEQEIRAQIVNTLKEMSDTANDEFSKSPTIENQNKADLLTFLIAPENHDHIFIFYPLKPASLHAWLEILKSRPEHAASELALIGTEEDKREFIEQFHQTLTDGTAVLKAVAEFPGEIKTLEQKERDLVDWVANNKPPESATDKPDAPNTSSTTAETSESLKEIRELIAQTKNKIDDVNTKLTTLGETQAQLKKDTDELFANTNIVDYKIYEFNETESYFKKVPEQSFEYCDGGIDLIVAKFCLHNKKVVTKEGKYGAHTFIALPAYTGSFTNIAYDAINIGCDRGGTPGKFEEKNEAKSYSFVVTTPERCDAYVKVRLQGPANKHPGNVEKLSKWEKDFDENKVSISQLNAQLAALETAKLGHEARGTEILSDIEKFDREQNSFAAQKKTEEFNTKKTKLEETKTTLAAAREKYAENLAIFEQKKDLYKSIEVFRLIIGFNSTESESFQQFYVAALTQQNKMSDYPSVKRCDEEPTVAPESPREEAKPARFPGDDIPDDPFDPIIIEGSDDEQSADNDNFLFPGAKAAAIPASTVCDAIFGKGSLVHEERMPTSTHSWTPGLLNQFYRWMTGSNSAGCITVAGNNHASSENRLRL